MAILSFSIFFPILLASHAVARTKIVASSNRRVERGTQRGAIRRIEEISTNVTTTTDGRNTTIASILSEREDLRTFLALSNTTDFIKAFRSGYSDLSIFVPNNRAIELHSTVNVGADKSTFIGAHVVDGRILSSNLTDGMVLSTASGLQLEVSKQNSTFTLAPEECGTVVTVLEADIKALGSIMFVVDGVIQAGPGCNMDDAVVLLADDGESRMEIANFQSGVVPEAEAVDTTKNPNKSAWIWVLFIILMIWFVWIVIVCVLCVYCVN